MTKKNDSVLLQGNEACVLGAIRAGMKFYSGYPITPSSEIAEEASKLLPKNGGKFIQMEDEIAGIACAIGGIRVGPFVKSQGNQYGRDPVSQLHKTFPRE